MHRPIPPEGEPHRNSSTRANQNKVLPAGKRQSFSGINHRTPQKVAQQLRKQADGTVKRELEIEPTNRIYNERKPMKHIELLNHSTYLYRPKMHEETETKIVKNQDLAARPLSSNCSKWKKAVENTIVASNGRDEVRPGSSKSSRLFKKKRCLAQDNIKSQNDEVQQTLIKVNNREKDFKATLRQRISTSISKKIVGMERIESKLDPQFFNLFAS